MVLDTQQSNADGSWRDMLSFWGGAAAASVALIVAGWFRAEPGKLTGDAILVLVLACTCGSLLSVSILGLGIQLTARGPFHVICGALAGSRRRLIGAGATLFLLVLAGTYGAFWLLDAMILPALLGQASVNVATAIVLLGAAFLGCVALVVRVCAMLVRRSSNR